MPDCHFTANDFNAVIVDVCTAGVSYTLSFLNSVQF